LAGGEPTRFKRKHPLPSPGDRFGSLTVLAPVGKGESLRILVACDCGATFHFVQHSNLVRGKTTRCDACAKIKAVASRKKYFGYADVVPDIDDRSRLLGRYYAAVSRCHNPKNAQFHNYGARGIEVYAEWRNDKRKFLEHAVTLPGWDNADLDMDRTDVNGNYEPGNLRFITRSENQGNRRKIGSLQARVDELERRLRCCSCGAAQPVHD
jgi:hypothetical protein